MFKTIQRKSISIMLIGLSLFLVLTHTARIPGINQSIAGDKEISFKANINTEINQITDFNLHPKSVMQNNTVLGEPITITPRMLTEEDYTIAQAPNGTYYCVWSTIITASGYTYFYTKSNSSDGLNWSKPIPFFRTEDVAYDLDLIVDAENKMHLFLLLSRSIKHQIIYLTNLDSENITTEEIFTTITHDISEVVPVISNNVITVAWQSKLKISSSTDPDNIIQITRYNISSSQWLPEVWNIANSSDPLLFDITANTQTLKLAYSFSANNSDVQDFMLTTYNETTKLWKTPTNLTRTSDKINYINIENAPSGTSAVYITEENYYSLKYILCDENQVVVNKTNRLNNEGHHCEAGVIAYDSDNNTHLLMEDKSSFDYYAYHRIRFENGTWSNLTLLIDEDSVKGMYLFKSINSSYELNIFALVEGSLYTSPITNTLELVEQILLYYGTGNNYNPTLAIDSDGIMHLITYQYRIGSYEMIYQVKYLNETDWRIIGDINVNITNSFNSYLVFDKKETLYCFYITKYPSTNLKGLYYITKEKGSLNWSEPVLALLPSTLATEFYKPAVLFDNNNTIHLFWAQVYNENYHMHYSYCYENSTIFSTPERIENVRTDSECYSYYAMIDMNQTIHLVNGEYSNEFDLTSLIYHYKEFNSSWSDAEVITASYDIIIGPKIIQHSTGKLELIYNNAEIVSIFHHYYWTDFEIFQKMPNDQNWAYSGSPIKDSASYGLFDVLLNPDDSMYIVFFDGNFTGSWWHDPDLERLAIKYRSSDGIWNETVDIMTVHYDKTQPILLKNPISNMIDIILEYGSDILWFSQQNDTDSDLLGNYDEYVYCTKEYVSDTDLDGLTDGYEVTISKSNPLLNDTDWDQIIDGIEVNSYGSNPLSIDSDRDGVSDTDEILIYGSNPISQDSDQDELNDYKEIFELGSDPTSADSDGDGMPDLWEYENGLNLIVDDSQNDEDDDDLSNYLEYLSGTDIYNNDTDSDLLTDGEEVLVYLTNPNNADTDYDTLTDWEEIKKFNTSPFDSDTDGDGFSDRSEIESGTDPNDPSDNTKLRRVRSVLLYSIIPISTLIIIIIIVEANYRKKNRTLIKQEENELAEFVEQEKIE